jgi:hypothetical protein
MYDSFLSNMRCPYPPGVFKKVKKAAGVKIDSFRDA